MSKQAIDNMKDTSASSETVKCAIRCRPLNKKEMTNGNEVAVKMDTKRMEIFVSKPGGEDAPKSFTFDNVYDWNC
tara:strand:- start:2143 stop:2367 length:225 start_codon:yes stop_codon:yes gene_type:complete